MHTRLLKISGTTMFAMLCAAMLVAQEKPRAPAAPPAQPRQQLPQNRQQVTANRPVEGAQNADRTIAECLAIANQEEVALANMAASKTDNSKVKQFAEMLVKDHDQFLSQLENFGAPHVALRTDRKRGAGRPDTDQQARNRRDASEAAIPQQRTAAYGPDGLNHNEIKRQIAEKCIQAAQRNWDEKKGQKADLCFLGQQAVSHQQMIVALEVLRDHASPQLQQVIDQGISTSKSHLSQNEKLIDEVAQRDDSKDRDSKDRDSEDRNK